MARRGAFPYAEPPCLIYWMCYHVGRVHKVQVGVQFGGVIDSAEPALGVSGEVGLVVVVCFNTRVP